MLQVIKLESHKGYFIVANSVNLEESLFLVVDEPSLKDGQNTIKQKLISYLLESLGSYEEDLNEER